MTDPTQDYPRSRPQTSYLILVQSMIVTLDIRLAIADAVPFADIVVVHDAAEAGRTLDGMESIHVAFLELAPDSDACLSLGQVVRRLGGRVVLLGDEAEDLGPRQDWTVLERPFTNGCILAALTDPAQAGSVWPTRCTKRTVAFHHLGPGIGPAMFTSPTRDHFAR